MAYFSNGTEGMMYESEYCEKCIHYRDRDDTGSDSCPIWDLHYEFNYDQGGKTKTGKAIKQFLETLIPTKKDGLFADECSMFIRDTTLNEDEYAKHLQAGEPPIAYLTKI